jgi:hypothetical protein
MAAVAGACKKQREETMLVLVALAPVQIVHTLPGAIAVSVMAVCGILGLVVAGSFLISR